MNTDGDIDPTRKESPSFGSKDGGIFTRKLRKEFKIPRILSGSHEQFLCLRTRGGRVHEDYIHRTNKTTSKIT